MEQQQPKLLSIRDAAKRLGVHYLTMLRMVEIKQVKSTPINKRFRIPESEIERMLRGDPIQ